MSYRLFIFYRSAFLASWVTFNTILMFWIGPVHAENSTVVPFSLEKKYHPLTREDLREIFFGRRTRWPDGTPLRVYVLPDQNPIHIRFAKEILGVYPYQLRSAWDRMVYSGTGVPPRTVESLEEMQKRLSQTPGSIGYIEQ